jgi:hypothetical protein
MLYLILDMSHTNHTHFYDVTLHQVGDHHMPKINANLQTMFLIGDAASDIHKSWVISLPAAQLVQASPDGKFDKFVPLAEAFKDIISDKSNKGDLFIIIIL